MRALLSVVGTRGDVQPVLALALRVREHGHDVRLCIPPNFIEWATSLGFAATPVGIEMRAPRPGDGPPKPIPDLIADQFDSIHAKADDEIGGETTFTHAVTNSQSDVVVVEVDQAPLQRIQVTFNPACGFRTEMGFWGEKFGSHG